MKKSVLKLLFFAALAIGSGKCFAQQPPNADPGINITMQPTVLELGSTGTCIVKLGNFGNDSIVANSLRATISVGIDCEILGIDTASSDPRWTILNLSTGNGNTILLKNTGGTLGSFDTGTVNLIIKATVVNPPSNFGSNIVYITANNPLLGGAPNSAQGNASIGNDNSSTSLGVTAPLPIHLTSFTASAEPGKCATQLQWTTGEEKNFDHFNVQSGRDGETFENIGTVKSKGNVMGSTYSYAADQPGGKSYYRLEMVDLDGATSFSNVLSVSVQCDGNAAATWSVYPNPGEAGNSQHLSYTSVNANRETIKAVITDVVGRQVWSSELEAAPGQNVYMIPSGSFARGSYYVNLYDQKGNRIYQTEKMVLK